jgi:hypothetical protein
MKLFQVISWDLIMDLPKSGAFDSVLMIADHSCMKVAMFIPCTKEVVVEGVVTLYAEKVFSHYGVPQWIISDHDPCFTAKFAIAVCKVLNITQNISTAYHLQTDGQLECTNAWVEQYL